MANERSEAVSPSSSNRQATDGAEAGARPTLSTEIDADILRGVPISTVLAGFGRVFASSASGQSDYVESVSTSKLDDFVSHDWGSSRLEKFLALCLIHNGPAASIISILVALITHVLQSKLFLGILPYARPYDPEVADLTDYWMHYGIWAQLLCPLVFTLVYFFWQQLQNLLCKSVRLVFLDKMCIHQRDPVKKTAGIKQLAGFLSKSDRFVVCWSKRYFTRLWCLYELASWLHLEKSLKSVTFVPLSYGLIICMSFIFFSLMSLVVTFGFPLSSTVSLLLFTVVFFTITPPFSPLLRNIIHHLRALPEQIEDFTINGAHCYCCSVDHEDPLTGEVIPCDRDLIYRTLTKWFPPSGSEVHSAGLQGQMAGVDPRSLRKFDETVRKLFGPFVLDFAGPTQVRYHHAVMGSLPYVWRAFDVAVAFGAFPDAEVVMWATVRQLVVSWATLPAAFKLIVLVASLQDRVIGKPITWWQNALANASLSFMAVCIMMLLFIPVELADWYGQPLGNVAAWLLQVTLVVLCYNGARLGMGRKRASQVMPLPD